MSFDFGTTLANTVWMSPFFIVIGNVISARFWDFTQRRMVIPKRDFRTTYRLFRNVPKFQKSADPVYIVEEA